jgi:DNA-binding transcriptional MerR regulator
MYSIGEFSRINRITPKTLRHYDRIGLLKPVKVDDWTGYRYYSARQLPRIRRILMLRDFGFSLKEIREAVENGDQMDQLLEQHINRIRDSIQNDTQRLTRAEGFLKVLRGEEKMDVEIKSLPEVTVASMRTKIESYDTFFEIVPQMGEYMKSVGAECLEPAYCFTIYHDGEYREHDIDAEVCEAVVKPCKESDRVRFKTIAGYPEAACLKHKGPYSTIGDTYNRLFTWISENGYSPVDHPREKYIDGIWNRENETDWLTEVQVPIEKKTG